MKIYLSFFFLIFLTVQVNALTLNELVSELSKRSNIKWRATNVRTQNMLGLKQNLGQFGLINNKQKSIFNVILPPKNDNLPDHLDWRDNKGVNWITDVKNQGYCGSCISFATLGTVEAQINITNNNPNLDVDLSEQHLLSCGAGSCNGTYPFTGIAFLKSNGVPDETCFPYTSGRMGEELTCRMSCPEFETRLYKIESYKELWSYQEIKKALQSGPIYTTMTVYEDLMFYKSGIYEHVTGEELGGHAVVIVGYDEPTGSWIIKNSWGTHWGERGYFRIKRKDASEVGNWSHQVFVAPLDGMVKISYPNNLDALRGHFYLKAQNFSQNEINIIDYLIKDTDTGAEVKMGRIDTHSFSTIIDTHEFRDGLYEIKIRGVTNSGKTLNSHSVLVFFANEPQNINLKLTKDFDDRTGTVSKRIYFKLNADTSHLPPGRVSLFLKNKNSSYKKRITIENPGKLFKIGWRTGVSPNGEYFVYAKAYIGKLAIFKSNVLEVSVQNQQEPNINEN